MWALYSHNRYSEGARALSQALNIPLYHERNSHRMRLGTKLINWGSSSLAGAALNPSQGVRIATNKSSTLQVLKNKNIPTVEFTFNKEEAKKWVESGSVVYCRTLTSSSGGLGIIVATNTRELVSAPLYTKGVMAPKEYRVHVINNRIIDITRKLRPDGTEPNQYIRNHENGWIFAREGCRPSRSVLAYSKLAIKALGLSFGAVDIMEKDNKVYILEINTAPGIEGTTLEKYTKAFKEIVNAK